MGTNASKKKGNGDERLAKHGGCRTSKKDSKKERKKSVNKKSAIGWTEKSGPVHVSEKTVVWERQRKTSQALSQTLSSSLRYSDFSRVVRKISLERDDLKPLYIPYEISEVDQPDDLCHICSVYTGGSLVMCKVCLHVYHESCLSKIGQDGNVPKFRSDGHWSCHVCDDVSSLLTEEELERLSKIFEKYNIMKGRNLLHTEILAFWKQQFLDKVASGMDVETERRLVDVIYKMDPENRGIVMWKNFLNHEALKILNKRNKNSLLRLLTSSEIHQIRNKFKLFDHNKQGFIMKDNALALLNASESLYCIQDFRGDPELSSLESQVTWQKFLMMQCIYSLAARLNVWYNSHNSIDANNVSAKSSVSDTMPSVGRTSRNGSETSSANKNSSAGTDVPFSTGVSEAKRDSKYTQAENRRESDKINEVSATNGRKFDCKITRNRKSTNSALTASFTDEKVQSRRHCYSQYYPPSFSTECDKKENTENKQAVKDLKRFTKGLEEATEKRENKNVDKMSQAENKRYTDSRSTRSFKGSKENERKSIHFETVSRENCSGNIQEDSTSAKRDNATPKELKSTAQESADKKIPTTTTPVSSPVTSPVTSPLASPTSKISGNFTSMRDSLHEKQTLTEAAHIQFIRCSSAHRATKSLYVLKGTPGRNGHMDLRRPVSMA